MEIIMGIIIVSLLVWVVNLKLENIELKREKEEKELVEWPEDYGV
jgi:hypothetical protein